MTISEVLYENRMIFYALMLLIIGMISGYVVGMSENQNKIYHEGFDQGYDFGDGMLNNCTSKMDEIYDCVYGCNGKLYSRVTGKKIYEDGHEENITTLVCQCEV